MYCNSLQQIKDNCNRRAGRYWILLLFFSVSSSAFVFLLTVVWRSCFVAANKGQQSIWFDLILMPVVLSATSSNLKHFSGKACLFFFFHIKWLLVIAEEHFLHFKGLAEKLFFLALCPQLEQQTLYITHYETLWMGSLSWKYLCQHWNKWNIYIIHFPTIKLSCKCRWPMTYIQDKK